MVQNSGLHLPKLGSLPERSSNFTNDPVVESGDGAASCGPLVLPIACQILAQILDAVLESERPLPVSDCILNNAYDLKTFAGKLVLDLCLVSEQLLLSSSEHRSCAIRLLLPTIFKAYSYHPHIEVSSPPQTIIYSRKAFIEKIWNCCKTMFSLGNVERRDAYCVLSLCLSFSPYGDEFYHAEMNCHSGEFDIRDDKEFWGEIKRGLVGKEGYVRKQSLHILKMVLGIHKVNQIQDDISDNKIRETHQNARVMTKREIWADKEARSLGVESARKSIENNYLDSRQSWEAFILLYEMLEEYGTHLVEAAWKHQILSVLRFCRSHDNYGTDEDILQHLPMYGGFSTWLSILWDRGFQHDNPQVRCLILESFVGIEWNKFGICVKALPESFIFGPLMQGLNDPIHHEDFGFPSIPIHLIHGFLWLSIFYIIISVACYWCTDLFFVQLF
ncbi:hypothetical protein SAY87_014001 [Trapa incisa]|uniref:Uncharacterized protein n=1 Tax=Trapa incisa TaxID=236973 RepID=A0AAN7JKS0_9MYRT|nr:hypothetical protein SAY87_014001 [Trapa incisa]